MKNNSKRYFKFKFKKKYKLIHIYKIFRICATAATAFCFTAVYYQYKDGSFYSQNSIHQAKSNKCLELSDALTNTITDEAILLENQNLMRTKMEVFVTNLQGQLIQKLQEIEPESKFIVDRWNRKQGGGGITCITQDGKVFERAAVNVSVVTGTLPPAAVQQMRAR